MNKYQKKVSKMALTRYKEIERQIIIPIKGECYCEVKVSHPQFETLFYRSKTIRRFKREARAELNTNNIHMRER